MSLFYKTNSKEQKLVSLYNDKMLMIYMYAYFSVESDPIFNEIKSLLGVIVKLDDFFPKIVA